MSTTWNVNVALFITVIFEVVKNGCCILFPSFKEKKPELLGRAKIIWILLMIFSLLCTMIYTTNVLFKDIVLDEQTKITDEHNVIIQEIEKINSDIEDKKFSLRNKENELKTIQYEYFNEISGINDTYIYVDYKNKFIENYIVNETEAFDNAAEALLAASEEAGKVVFSEDQTHYVSTGLKRYEAIKEEYEYTKEALSEARENAEVIYNNDWEDIISKTSEIFRVVEETLNAEMSILNDEINVLNGTINSLKTKISEADGGENEKYTSKYIETLNIFILYWVHVFKTASGYERAYLIIIGIISLVIATMMEYIIYFVNQIIGQPIKILWDLLVPKDDDLNNSYKELMKKCEGIVLIAVKASLCSATYLLLYLVSGIINNVNIMDWQHNVKLLLIMAGVYFIVYYIFNKTTLPEGTNEPEAYEPSEIIPERIKNVLKVVVPASRKWWTDIVNSIPTFVF
ncbi:MAG: hypothetical protein IJX15_05405, partial [Ruminiclostridium sp.]|nr:hypothetical protein [Ruminiclostridium sp.]